MKLLKKSDNLFRVEKFLKKHEEKIVLGIAFILVFLIGFLGGRFFGLEKKVFKNPIQILENESLSKVSAEEQSIPKTLTEDQLVNKDNSNQQEIVASKNVVEEKRFVGSISSDKYHKPDCSSAQKIKEKIWFSSEEEAKAKGYQRAKCCFKESNP